MKYFVLENTLKEGLLRCIKFFGYSLFILIASCKKSDDKQISVQDHQVKSVWKETQLCSIKEKGSNTTLDIKGKGASVVIYNSSPGHPIGNDKSEYKIVDEFGKEYTFSSGTIFGAYSATPLNGRIKIYKDNTLVFEENYDFSKVHFCTANNPLINDSKGAYKTSGVGRSKNYWKIGQDIIVKFSKSSDSDPSSAVVKKKIEKYAKVWEEYANIKFVFDESTASNADILISLTHGISSSSYVGKVSSESAKSNKTTMNFGWFHDNTSEEEFSRVVLHEFGHALGLEHEQLNPHILKNIDERAFILYEAGLLKKDFIEKNNIKKEKKTSEEEAKISEEEAKIIDIATQKLNDFFKKTSTQLDDYSVRHDKLSIMHYPLPEIFFIDKIGVEYNYHLSDEDKAFIKTIYPPALHELYHIKNVEGKNCVTIIRDTKGGDIYAYKHEGSFLDMQNKSYIIRPSIGDKSKKTTFNIGSLNDDHHTLIGKYLPPNRDGQGIDLLEKLNNDGLKVLFSEALVTPIKQPSIAPITKITPLPPLAPITLFPGNSFELAIHNNYGEKPPIIISRDERDGTIWVMRSENTDISSIVNKRFIIKLGGRVVYRINPSIIEYGYTDIGIKVEKNDINNISIEMLDLDPNVGPSINIIY